MTERVAHLVRQHMFNYEPAGATRRSGGSSARSGATPSTSCSRCARPTTSAAASPPTADGLDELRARVAAELASGPVLDRSALAIDGDDLIAELGLKPGPQLGRILDALLERVIEDPALNDAPTLLLLARDLVADDR